MIELRPFDALGGADHGWLKAKHHFSFARYHDPERMGHGSLRVWNDDEIAPNTGFPPHPHAEMEIITYVRQARSPMRTAWVIKGRTEAGDVQVMSAGSGIRHAEFNREPCRPRSSRSGSSLSVGGGEPSWGAKPFPKGDRSGRFVPLRAASPATPRRCRSGPRPAFSAPRSKPVRPPNTSLGPSGTSISSRRSAASRSTASASARATAPPSPTRPVLAVKALEDAEIVLVDAA